MSITIKKADVYGLDVYHMLYFDKPLDHLPGFNRDIILAGNFAAGFVLFEPENTFSGEDARWRNNGLAPTACPTTRFPVITRPFKEIQDLTWNSKAASPEDRIDPGFHIGGFMGAGGLAEATLFLGPGFSFSEHFISTNPEQDKWIIDNFTNQNREPEQPYWGHCFYNCGMWADHFMETTRNMMPLDN